MLVAAVALALFGLWRTRHWGRVGWLRVVLGAVPAGLFAAPYLLAGLEDTAENPIIFLNREKPSPSKRGGKNRKGTSASGTRRTG